MVNIVKKSLLVSVMALAFTQAYAATDYEIRMPSGSTTATTAPAASPDGALNTGIASAVPVLTAASSKLTFSSNFGGGGALNQPWQSFNGIGSLATLTASSQYGWILNTSSQGWIAYQFDAPIIINKYAFYGESGSGAAFNSLPKDFSLQASDDGSSWVTLGSETNATVTASDFNYFTVVNSTAYLYYKLNITDNQGATTYLGTTEIKFIAAQ